MALRVRCYRNRLAQCRYRNHIATSRLLRTARICIGHLILPFYPLTLTCRRRLCASTNVQIIVTCSAQGNQRPNLSVFHSQLCIYNLEHRCTGRHRRTVNTIRRGVLCRKLSRFFQILRTDCNRAVIPLCILMRIRRYRQRCIQRRYRNLISAASLCLAILCVLYFIFILDPLTFSCSGCLCAGSHKEIIIACTGQSDQSCHLAILDCQLDILYFEHRCTGRRRRIVNTVRRSGRLLRLFGLVCLLGLLCLVGLLRLLSLLRILYIADFLRKLWKVQRILLSPLSILFIP